MTVLEKKAASGVDVRGFASYVAVGALSVAIGVGVGLGLGGVAENQFGSPAQQALAERGAAVGEHLDSIWQTGLAQQQAIQSAQVPRAAMEMRGAAMADHVDTLTRTGAAMQDLYGG